MPERLKHPGFFRRIIFGERLSQETLTEIEQFKSLRKALH
jgi:hypothetical protein